MHAIGHSFPHMKNISGLRSLFKENNYAFVRQTSFLPSSAPYFCPFIHPLHSSLSFPTSSPHHQHKIQIQSSNTRTQTHLTMSKHNTHTHPKARPSQPPNKSTYPSARKKSPTYVCVYMLWGKKKASRALRHNRLSLLFAPHSRTHSINDE
jgi:hypothetical protein